MPASSALRICSNIDKDFLLFNIFQILCHNISNFWRAQISEQGKMNRWEIMHFIVFADIKHQIFLWIWQQIISLGLETLPCQRKPILFAGVRVRFCESSLGPSIVEWGEQRIIMNSLARLKIRTRDAQNEQNRLKGIWKIRTLAFRKYELLHSEKRNSLIRKIQTLAR